VESVQLGQPALLRANSKFGNSIEGLAGLITGRGREAARRPVEAPAGIRRLFSMRGRTDDTGVAPVTKLPDQQ
jgi:hypothetical protein